jgi:hypothetical protein
MYIYNHVVVSAWPLQKGLDKQTGKTILGKTKMRVCFIEIVLVILH